MSNHDSQNSELLRQNFLNGLVAAISALVSTVSFAVTAFAQSADDRVGYPYLMRDLCEKSADIEIDPHYSNWFVSSLKVDGSVSYGRCAGGMVTISGADKIEVEPVGNHKPEGRLQVIPWLFYNRLDSIMEYFSKKGD